MHLRNVGGAKTDTGQALALLGNDRADPVRSHAETLGRHQLQRHVVKCEQHAVGAIAGAPPRRCAAKQRLVGRGGSPDIVDQKDDVIEPGDHGKSPRVFLAARTFSTPIAIAAVRWGTLSAFARITTWSNARSRM